MDTLSRERLTAEHFRRQLETVCNNATLALFIMDERQRCTYMNPAAEALTGYTLAEVQDRALHDVIHHTRPDGTPYPMSECPIDRALPERNQVQGEDVFVHKNGQFYPVAYTASPIREGDQMTGTIIEVRDIREEKQIKEQREEHLRKMRELERAKTIFFNSVSHEFRTPLTLMLASTEEALEEPALPAEQRERWRLVRRNGTRLLKLVNTLLDFSRIEAGLAHVVPEPVDLSAFTRELASLFASAMARAGLRFVVDCPPLPESICVDRDMWEKIVLNLLSNALKFTIEGEVSIALRLREGHVELTVRDTGCGIPEDELPRIFERFHQVRGRRSRTHEGTGIGLSLVKELVQMHGGCVTAASRPDEGTTFSVTIPAGPAHLAPEQSAPPAAKLAPSHRAASYVDEALGWTPEGAEDAMFARERVVIERQVAHMVRLVDDLLDVARIVRGKIELRKERVELIDVASRAIETAMPLIVARQHRIEVDIDRPLLVDADPTRLGQVIANLLTNAAKYTDPRGAGGGGEAPTDPTDKRVLIVDDNCDAAELLAEGLSVHGYGVRVACDAPTAIALARELRPDVALLDIGLPVMNGYELIQRLRDELRGTRFIAVTGYGQASDVERSRSAGFAHHLVKPVDMDALVKLLSELTVEAPGERPAGELERSRS